MGRFSTQRRPSVLEASEETHHSAIGLWHNIVVLFKVAKKRRKSGNSPAINGLVRFESER